MPAVDGTSSDTAVVVLLSCLPVTLNPKSRIQVPHICPQLWTGPEQCLQQNRWPARAVRGPGTQRVLVPHTRGHLCSPVCAGRWLGVPAAP
jgi:hypothetical protein